MKAGERKEEPESKPVASWSEPGRDTQRQGHRGDGRERDREREGKQDREREGNRESEHIRHTDREIH